MNEVIQKHMADFQAACSRLNIPADLPSMPNLPKSFEEHHQASHMIMVFVADKKKGKTAAYGDPMFYPWWYRADSAGSGFRLHVVDFGNSCTAVGAPFESFSRGDSKEIADKYPDLYELRARELTI